MKQCWRLAWDLTSAKGFSSWPGRPPSREPGRRTRVPGRGERPGKVRRPLRLTQQELDGNGAQTSLVQAAVIRDVTQGIVPQRQTINGRVPFNLMKSEQLVWVIQDVDYLETVVRRERQGTSHGVSIRITRAFTTGPAPFAAAPPCGGDGTRRHRPPGPHDQAPLLRGEPEEVPRPLRPHCLLRPLRGRVRHHEGSAERQATGLPHRRRLVRLQPGDQPGADVEEGPRGNLCDPDHHLHQLNPRTRERPTHSHPGTPQLWKHRLANRALGPPP